MFTDLAQINQAITNYQNLIALVEAKVKVLQKFSSYYDTCRGIERIYFDERETRGIVVVCDDSFQGCNYEHTFEFPFSWLVKSDEELEQLVTEEREAQEERERIQHERMELEQKKAREKAELAQYNRLKAKYG